MKSIKHNLIGLAFVVTLLVSVIIYLFSSGLIHQITEAYRNLNHNYLLFAVFFIFCYWFFGALALYAIVKHFNKEFKLTQAFEIIMIGQLFNGITPFASGGQPMQVVALRKNGIRASKGTSSLMIKFVVYQIVLVTISTILIVLKYVELKNYIDFLDLFVILGFGLNLIIAAVIIFLCVAKESNTKTILRLGKLLKKLHIIKDYEEFEQKAKHYIHDFHEYSDILRSNTKILFVSTVLTIIQISALLFIPYLIIRSFGLTPDMLAVVASASFILMVTSLVPIPGASGGAEGGFILIMGLFLINAQLATGLVIWRAITYYLGIFSGAGYYIYHLLKKGQYA